MIEYKFFILFWLYKELFVVFVAGGSGSEDTCVTRKTEAADTTPEEDRSSSW